MPNISEKLKAIETLTEESLLNEIEYEAIIKFYSMKLKQVQDLTENEEITSHIHLIIETYLEWITWAENALNISRNNRLVLQSKLQELNK